MSNALHAKGTLIRVETAEGSGVYQTIPEVGDIDGPNFSAGVLQATSHDTAGNFHEFKADVIDPGEISFPINYIESNAVHKQVVADFTTRTERTYRKVYTTAVFLQFRAQVIGFSERSPVSGALQTATVRLKILAAPTLPV